MRKMKKYILLLCCIVQFGFANEQTFKKANEYYKNENYQAALQLFESIANKGVTSSDLYFNIGNCYYKLGKTAPAIYNYEKGLLLNPNDEALKTNLSFAQKLAIDDIKIVPEVGFKKILKNATNSLHYDTWAWLAIAFAFFGLANFLGYYFSGTVLLKRLFFSTFLLALGIVIVSVSAGFYNKKLDLQYNPALVFAATSPLKAAPKNSSETVLTLHEGTKVNILQELGNWNQVQLSDKTIAWINKNDIKNIKD